MPATSLRDSADADAALGAEDAWVTETGPEVDTATGSRPTGRGR